MTTTSAQRPHQAAHAAPDGRTRRVLWRLLPGSRLRPLSGDVAASGRRPALRFTRHLTLLCACAVITTGAYGFLGNRGTSAEDWPAWRHQWLMLVQQDAAGALVQLRRRHDLAREQGDTHGEWLHLAWLLRQTAALDHGRTGPWLMLAEQALQAAQGAGDKVAMFELLVAIETARLDQQMEGPREARLTRAEALAVELGDPIRSGLVGQLRGLAALYEGQPGEALVQLQRARPMLTHPQDQDEVRQLMAWAALAQPGLAGAEQAERHLKSQVQAAAPALPPVGVNHLLLQAEIERRTQRTAEAVSHAQQAVALARQQAAPTLLSRAQLALGQAHLAAGNTLLALAHLQSSSLDALPPADKLLSLATSATALAQRDDPQASRWLAQGQRLIEQTPHLQRLAVLQFHETVSGILARMGDPDGALRALSRATALRTAMAESSREQLVQARIDVAGGAAAQAADAQQERWLATGVAGLLLVLAGLAGLTLRRARQRQRLTRQASDLETANAELHAAYAARQRHLAAACQDLHQPARVIGQVADAALAQLQHTEALSEAQCQAVRRCSHTLTDMLDAILDPSALEHGHCTPQLQAVPLGELLAELDLQYRRAALDKGLTWQVTTSTAHVQADRHLLRRVLFNLASNAVRHSTQGGIQILAVATDTQVWVDVADTGPGLPAEQLAATTVAQEAPAYGLGPGSGLAIVREACRLMAHELTVPLSSPLGSVVRVTMPRSLPAPGAAAPCSLPFSGQTVAVVEADRASRQALVEALGAAGLQAASFVSLAALREASAAYPTTGPDLLVVDLGAQALPAPASALQAWLQDCPTWRTPALVLTADISLASLLHATELGLHLACKPISPARLIELLHGLLASADAATPGAGNLHLEPREEVMAS